ncbi:MAG: hypothetical protein PHW29_00470 [Flavobacterium sp.]|jgi:hypothetical protein|nr:hypothetical protein [Flavobacterium sp.]
MINIEVVSSESGKVSMQFNLEWEGKYLPRTGDTINFGRMHSKTCLFSDADEETIQKLSKDNYAIESIIWNDEDDILMIVEKL